MFEMSVNYKTHETLETTASEKCEAGAELHSNYTKRQEIKVWQSEQEGGRER